MPRTSRTVRARGFYHVLNWGNGRATIFHDDADFAAFARVLAEGLTRYPVDLYAWCLMSNHWHLVLSPRSSQALGDFMRWIGVTHVRRHQERHQTRGGGHLYQGRFKSFPIQKNDHFLTVCRFVEANAKRAGLVKRVEDWSWTSLQAAAPQEEAAQTKASPPPWPKLGHWPVPRPRGWLGLVNRVMSKRDQERLKTSIKKGRPYGDDTWVAKTSAAHGLGHTLRNPGRPKKTTGNKNK